MTTQALAPQALGYVGIRAKDLGDWASYGSGLLGLQRVDRSRSTLAFRMDDRKQRLIVDADGGEGIGFFGWEVADAGALDALAARLEAKAFEVVRGSRALADGRCVKDLIVLRDPVGNRLEIFHGAETATEPFKPGRSISGFRTGPLGLGHVVLNTDKPDTTDRLTIFYCDLLGFRLTDYYSEPFFARFLHINPRHHSVAFIQTGKNGVHHLMLELFSLDDVRIWLGSAFDRCRDVARLRAERRPEHVGPRSLLALAGRQRQGPRASPRQRRQRPPPAGSGPRRQLRTHVRRLPVVGSRQVAHRRAMTRCSHDTASEREPA